MNFHVEISASRVLFVLVVQMIALQTLDATATSQQQLQQQQQQQQLPDHEAPSLLVNLSGEGHIVLNGSFLTRFLDCLCWNETLTCGFSGAKDTARQGLYKVLSFETETMNATQKDELMNLGDTAFVCDQPDLGEHPRIACTRELLSTQESDCLGENGGCTFFSIELPSTPECNLTCVNVLWRQNITAEYSGGNNSHVSRDNRCGTLLSEKNATELSQSDNPALTKRAPFGLSEPTESPTGLKLEPSTSGDGTSMSKQLENPENADGKPLKNNNNAPQIGAIVGAAVGGFGTAAILVSIIAFCSFRRWKQQNSAAGPGTFGLDQVKPYTSGSPGEMQENNCVFGKVKGKESSDKIRIVDAEKGQHVHVVNMDQESSEDVYENIRQVDEFIDNHKLRPHNATDQDVYMSNCFEGFGDFDQQPDTGTNHADSDYVTVDDLKSFERENSVSADAIDCNSSPETNFSGSGREPDIVHNTPGSTIAAGPGDEYLNQQTRGEALANNGQVGFQSDASFNGQFEISALSPESFSESHEPRDISDSENTEYFILEENFVEGDEHVDVMDAVSDNWEEQEVDNVYLDIEPEPEHPEYYQFRNGFD